MEYSVQQLKTEWVTSRGIALEDFLLLTLFVLQKSRTEFAREINHTLTEAQHVALLHLLERRLQHEPVAYLLKNKEFFGRDFFVNSATLIPRPDSECLIEDILQFFEKDTRRPDTICDIGTGSGALGITLAQELKTFPITILASDISSEALTVARQNATTYDAQVSFLQGSLLTPYHALFPLSAPLYIVANLPYVSETLFQSTAPDVQHYEPTTALLSDNQGLAHYIQLLQELKEKIISNPLTCWFEMSPEQSQLLSQAVRNVFPHAEIHIGQDLAHKDRFLRFTLS